MIKTDISSYIKTGELVNNNLGFQQVIHSQIFHFSTVDKKVFKSGIDSEIII